MKFAGLVNISMVTASSTNQRRRCCTVGLWVVSYFSMTSWVKHVFLKTRLISYGLVTSTGSFIIVWHSDNSWWVYFGWLRHYGPIIKIYMQNMNGIFTSGTSLLSSITSVACVLEPIRPLRGLMSAVGVAWMCRPAREATVCLEKHGGSSRG